MLKTSCLSVLVVMGILVGGVVPLGAYADDDKISLEIESEDGTTKIEIKTRQQKVELKLDTTENDIIIDTILQYVDLPSDLIEKLRSIDFSAGKVEIDYNNEFENTKKHDDEDNFIKRDRSDDFQKYADKENYEEYDNKQNDLYALKSIEEAIQAIDMARETLTSTNETNSSIEELLFDAEFFLEEAQASFDIGDYAQAIELAEEAENQAQELLNILGVESGILSFDTPVISDMQYSELQNRIDQLEEENVYLKTRISDLEEEIKNLNAVIMEQLKVIYEWIINR